MGSKRATGSSPGERKAQTGNTVKKENQPKLNAKIQGKKADQFARQAVGLTKTDDGYMSTAYDSATGKSYKSGNQMYGATYNEARGRYLESQGLAKARQVTDAMGKTRTVYDPRTADGTYTNMTRMSAEEARANKTPLSKEMYASQQKYKAGLGAVTTLMGVPIIPSLLFNSATTPYSNYINQTNEQGFYNFSSTGKNPIDNIKNALTPTENKVSENEDTKLKTKKKYAGIGSSSMLKGSRTFLG